jgi:hypothetical protein
LLPFQQSCKKFTYSQTKIAVIHCQLAEISAAKHKVAAKKYQRPEKSVGELYRQRSSFLMDLAEIICQELATQLSYFKKEKTFS